MNDRWLVQFSGYDTNAVISTLLFCTGRGFTTTPSDTPPSEPVDARLTAPGNFSRFMFAGPAKTTGASRVGFGDVVLLNGDGGLNYLKNWGLDGRTITVMRTETPRDIPLYTDFSTAFVATMEQPEIGRKEVRLKFRDLRFSLKQPLQTTKYAGSGLGTLEGGADIKDKEKPVTYGSPKNVTPVCVETSKLIYQAHDAALTSIGVYDRGVALTAGRVPTLVTSGFGTDAIFVSAYGNGLYLMAGAAAKLSTSTNGTSWTARTSGFTADAILAAAYGGGVYVLGGGAGKIATSANGTTGYTLQTSGFGTGAIEYLTYSDDWTRFVAVGYDSVSAPRIATSTDGGVTWVSRTVPTITGVLKVVKAANHLIVAATDAGEILSSVDGGVTWVLRFTNTQTSYHGIAYGAGTWCVVGRVGATIASGATSLDGLTWTQRDGPFGAAIDANDVTYGDQFVAVGNGGRVASSRDGITWTTAVSVLTGFDINNVAYGAIGEVFGASSGQAAFNIIQLYGSSVALLNDAVAPAAGSYIAYLSSTGSYFRLGATPAGQITCDPVEGANAAARTAGQIFTKLLARKSLTPYAADITALDLADAAERGFYQGPEPVNVDECCDRVLSPSSWYIDKSGNLRSTQFTGPAATTILDLTPNDILSIERVGTTDDDRGIPSFRAIVNYDRNYTVQTSDLASAVTTDRRTFLAQEYRTAKDTDSAVQTKHLLAPEFTVDTLMTSAAAAATEATRQLTLRKADRDRFRIEVQLTDENLVADLATTIGVTHMMTGGTLASPETHRYVVLSVELITDNPKDRRIALSCWGPE